MSFILLSNNRIPIADPVLGNDKVLVKPLKKEVELIRVLSSLYGGFLMFLRRF